MTKKVIRKIIGALLIVSALVVYIIPSEQVDAVTASTTDFELDGTTLVKYSGTASTVSVPANVKVIDNEAFSDNSNITKISLPDSVEEIRYAAFSGCNNLSEITIPDGVETIGTAAFCNCSNLTKVSIGSGLKKLGNGVFTGCEKLEKVEFNNPRFVCKDSAIYDKDYERLYQVLPGKKEHAFSMANTVNRIMPYSFYGLSNLNAVTISPNIMEVPAYSFSNCTGLSEVYIPYSVKNIDAKAFENCVNLGNVKIPESVTYIHDTAFDGCPRLDVEAPEFSYAKRWFDSMDRSQVAIIDSEENLVDDSDLDSENSIDETPNEEPNPSEYAEPDKQEPTNKPNTIEDIANSYVSSEGLIGETIIVGRKAVVFIKNDAQTVVSGSSGFNNNTSGISSDSSLAEIVETLPIETNGKGVSLPKFAEVNNVIASKAYYDDLSLTNYTFDEGITKIGDFSFARSALKTIEIPAGVTDIGYGAFYHCDDLSNITIPSTVVNIEPAAFSKTRMMENWFNYGSGDYFICGDGILVAYRGKDSKINIPEGVKQIGPEAFKDHKGIVDVSLPDSLWRICEEAFSGCSNLKKVTGGVNLSVIEDRAFWGCPLDSVRVVDSVKEIGMGAFNYDITNAPDENRAVVFLGDDLPFVTYNDTTTRLSNENFRVDALAGCKVAIVNSESTERVGTVLDRSVAGFSGLVCTISEENNEYFNGRLNIIDCTLSPAEAELFTVPETMIVFGKGYNFNMSQLSSVLEMAKAGSFEQGDSSEEYTGISAYFDGSQKEYELFIDSDATPNADIVTAYKTIYAENVPANLCTYDIALKEKDNAVLLSKFGKQKLNVALSLPSNMPSNNLHVICLDEDKQLEDIPYKVVSDNGKLYVSFDISHTGKYGLYSFNSGEVSKYNLDESPETGDGVHPKTVLSIGLLLAGIALILAKKKTPIA
ncbi:MAG: leucine-rich repeat domain-containing protein [Lachnospiraceae bacterium]|nr:leucine-rich repeat domain-containing protein [Lachnospiraceae bacterium]